MNPWVIVGRRLLVAAVVPAAAWIANSISKLVVNESCAGCETGFSMLTHKHECSQCSKTYCSSCAPEAPKKPWQLLINPYPQGRLCTSCAQRIIPLVTEQLTAAMTQKLELYPRTYKGRTGADKSHTQYIVTEPFRDREHAREQLRVTAAWLDYRVVIDVNLLPQKRRRDNYIYTVWRAEGQACPLLRT